MLRRLNAIQPEAFVFSKKNEAWAKEQLKKFPEGRSASAVIPLLWRAQEQEGWLSRPAIEYVADFLEMDYISAGIFFGATIHDVAQVIGAGFTLSDETGDTATIIKLFRVTLLFPVVILISLLSYRYKSNNDFDNKPPLVPYFIIFFIIMVIINSLNLIPLNLQFYLNDISSWFLLIAISAVGTKTRLQSLKIIGFIPILSID